MLGPFSRTFAYFFYLFGLSSFFSIVSTRNLLGFGLVSSNQCLPKLLFRINSPSKLIKVSLSLYLSRRNRGTLNDIEPMPNVPRLHNPPTYFILATVLDCDLNVSLYCIAMLIMLTYDSRCFKMAFISCVLI